MDIAINDHNKCFVTNTTQTRRYFCRTCWQWQHTSDASLRNHKPMTRNSKSQHLIGIGPQLQASSNGSNGGAGSPPCAASMSPSSSAGFASSLGNLYQTE